jgi:gliding motility-associated-like protein
VIRPDITVFIPNAFTPNQYGPNINDRFFVHADGIKTFSIRIFDRWGEQVYQSNKLEEGWDGLYKGAPAQQDVYVYRVDVISNSDKDYSFYGTITLLR